MCVCVCVCMYTPMHSQIFVSRGNNDGEIKTEYTLFSSNKTISLKKKKFLSVSSVPIQYDKIDIEHF